MKCNVLLTYRKPPCNLYPAYWSMAPKPQTKRSVIPAVLGGNPSLMRDPRQGRSGMTSLLLFAFLILNFALPAYGSSGTEGAAFLDIPVGAGPASLGGAYSALADDAYAPTYNPGALGFVESNQFAAQHLSYLESIHYEYLSFVHPLHKGSSMGGSIQYLGTGDMAATDNS